MTTTTTATTAGAAASPWFSWAAELTTACKQHCDDVAGMLRHASNDELREALRSIGSNLSDADDRHLSSVRATALSVL